MTTTIATVKENLEHYTHGLPPQEWEFLCNELKTVQNPDDEVLQMRPIVLHPGTLKKTTGRKDDDQHSRTARLL